MDIKYFVDKVSLPDKEDFPPQMHAGRGIAMRTVGRQA